MTLASIIADDALTSAGRLDAGALRAWEYAPNSILGELLRQPGAFDFFHAVSLIERLRQDMHGMGKAAHPAHEPLRFRAAFGAAFPQSAICEILPPTDSLPQAEMTLALFGLTGPSGVLPRHYTQLLHRIQRDARGPEKHALRDWLDLFNHRLISQFYRAWKKYRFYSDAGAIADARRAASAPFSTAVFSFAGLGLAQLHDRLTVTAVAGDVLSRREKTLAKVDDLSLLRYSGLLAQRPRTAGNLKQLLRDYFGLPVEVRQFQGQWLTLEAVQQTRLGEDLGEGPANNQLGATAIAGSLVWDVQSKFRICIGPLNYRQFREFLPDHSVRPGGKAFFLFCQLARLFAGEEFDFDVQLVLDRTEIPPCQLSAAADNGARLGWNTWLCRQIPDSDAADAHFEADEGQRLDAADQWLVL